VDIPISPISVHRTFKLLGLLSKYQDSPHGALKLACRLRNQDTELRSIRSPAMGARIRYSSLVGVLLLAMGAAGMASGEEIKIGGGAPP